MVKFFLVLILNADGVFYLQPLIVTATGITIQRHAFISFNLYPWLSTHPRLSQVALVRYQLKGPQEERQCPG